MTLGAVLFAYLQQTYFGLQDGARRAVRGTGAGGELSHCKSKAWTASQLKTQPGVLAWVNRYKIAGVSIQCTAAWEALGQTGATGAESEDKTHHRVNTTGCRAAKHGAIVANPAPQLTQSCWHVAAAARTQAFCSSQSKLAFALNTPLNIPWVHFPFLWTCCSLLLKARLMLLRFHGIAWIFFLKLNFSVFSPHLSLPPTPQLKNWKPISSSSLSQVLKSLFCG